MSLHNLVVSSIPRDVTKGVPVGAEPQLQILDKTPFPVEPVSSGDDSFD